MYDIILFTDLTNANVPFKTMGVYKIANVLRLKGYKVKVVNNLLWILENEYSSFMTYLESVVTDNTKMFGFSTTFMSIVTDYKDEFLVSKSGFTKWHKQGERPTNKNINQLSHNYKIKPVFLKFLSELKCKFYKTKRVMGGDTATSHIIWNLCNDIEYWIQGLAETSIVEFMRKIDIVDTGIFKYDRYASLYDFHNENFHYTLEDGILENETLPFEMSRGCRFKCKFCSYPLLGRSSKDNKYLKSQDSIFREMKYNYENFNTKNYIFLCDTFNETTDKLLDIKNVIDKLKINLRFFSYLRIDLIHRYPEQISILRDMGVSGAHFGIESLNHEAAKSIGKGLHTDKVLNTLEKCKNSWGNDTIIHSGFIVGLPNDTVETVEEWSGWLEKNETPLTSWSLKALNMNMKADDKLSYQSEFDINAEKYGYDRSGKYWKNKHWTYKSANEWIDNFYKKSNKEYSKYRTPSPHKALSFLNLDFTWDEIFNSHLIFDQFKEEMHLRAEEKNQDYFNIITSE